MSTVEETNKEVEENKKRDRPRKDSDTKSDGDINSPESKKGRDEQYERMATFDTIDENLAVIYATQAVTKLSSETDNNNIRKLIDCYNPIISGDIEMMKKHMLAESEEWEDKEEIFKSAIKFVINNEEEVDETNLCELAEVLLAAIGNRMTKYCNDCKNWYIIGRENKPKILCSWCKVGIHDCLNVNLKENRQGTRWFCSECDEQFSKQIQPQMNKIRNIVFKGFSERDNQRTNLAIINKNIEKIRKETYVEKEVINIAEEENRKKTEENDTTGQEEERKQEEKNDDNIEETNNKEEKKKCWFWLNKKCKNGERCRYDHPTQCKVMLESGRCTDSRCKLSHPKICRGIYYNGYCSRRNCWYVHPTNIKNKYQNIETNNYTHQRDVNNNTEQNSYNRNWTPNNNVAWNQNNYNNTNPQSFLEQWPTPWETRKPLKLLIGNIVEEITKFMSR